MNEKEFDFFNDSLKIFIAYISRQHDENPNYKPNPIIRAFECALEALKEVKIGERASGLSQNGEKDNIYNPYIVVLEKREKGIEVKEIRNLRVDEKLSIENIIIVFRLQIHLDRIEGETVTTEQAVKALNEVIPGDNFYALGNEWKVARDNFIRSLKEGKVYRPDDEQLIEEISLISDDTPWEKYSARLRSLIGPFIGKEGKLVLTAPKSSKVEKFKVFDIAIEFLLGKVSEYFARNQN